LYFVAAVISLVNGRVNFGPYETVEGLFKQNHFRKLYTQVPARADALRRPAEQLKAYMTSFSELGLGTPTLRALAQQNHTTPTPIQIQAIPPIMAGRDLLGIAQTGTGKTAAFALPILNHLSQKPSYLGPKKCRVLVLTPTRELANQIGERFESYGQFLEAKTVVAIGGVHIKKQSRAMAAGAEILIATPGRLIDLVESKCVQLDSVEILVLDEADRMLDMGFVRPIRRIAGWVPKRRQSLFFSATMPHAIAGLADSLLSNPVKVSVNSSTKTADRIQQQIVFVGLSEKHRALVDILAREEVQRTLVFARTKRGADRIVRGLATSGVRASAIHGNKSQQQRERALDGFRAGRVPVLVATDIAARGIDVPAVTHVVNYDLPAEAESYVHRIGRTARAGAEGVALSICTNEDRANLRSIEKLIGIAIPFVGEKPGAEPRPARQGASLRAQPSSAKKTRPRRRRRGSPAHAGEHLRVA
jgi:ATP-dependent RNA helicase RhlE